MEKLGIMTHKETILRYLQSIYPDSATNADIRQALGFENHQDVFYPTRDLRESGTIKAKRLGREWHFQAKSKEQQTRQVSSPLLPETQSASMTPKRFEDRARMKFSELFGTQLLTGSVGNVAKEWDMVSSDRSIVGDAKYYTLVHGKNLPPAKFATIAEHVWLLEKTDAIFRFLVFGNQIEVPQLWLAKYGNLVSDVQFYFMDDDGKIERMQ